MDKLPKNRNIRGLCQEHKNSLMFCNFLGLFQEKFQNPPHDKSGRPSKESVKILLNWMMTTLNPLDLVSIETAKGPATGRMSCTCARSCASEHFTRQSELSLHRKDCYSRGVVPVWKR